MLGRLGMDVDECITAYNELTREVFGSTRHLVRMPVNMKGEISSIYDSQKLRNAIERVLESRNVPKTELLNNHAETSGRCRT